MPALNIETQLTKVRLSRLSINPLDGKKVSFGLDADFREITRAAGKVKLRFSLVVDTFPLVGRAALEGFANVDEKLLEGDGSAGTDSVTLNDLALAVFKQDFDSLFLLYDTMSLPYPSPWMVRDVKLHS
jgi:hypothetical protein